MYKKERYLESDKMYDLISNNYSMLLVMSRFGISPGFGEKTIGETCRQFGVDTCTFLMVVNFLHEGKLVNVEDLNENISLEQLVNYLHNAHDYFLRFRLPHLREKLTEAIRDDCPADVSFVISRFFDEYVAEVHKHMMYEEKTVFPYVRELLEGKKNPKYNIGIFYKRHDQIELKITELKNLLLKYYPGKGSHLLNSVLFDIFSTEQDLTSHNQIENFIFTPAISELEKRV